eukprot:6479668-Amphidinium_carterae.1
MGRGGKSKGSKPTEQDEAESYRQQMSDALPEAARRRTYPLLLGDWSVPICYPWDLQASGGVSYVRRNDLVEVVRRIGTTHQPVAVITAHTPIDLFMDGYQHRTLFVDVRVYDSGEFRDITMERHLVQLGFSAQVLPVVSGPQLVLHSTTVRMVAKSLPGTHLVCTVGFVAAYLLSFLAEEHVNNFMQRDGSVLFNLQTDQHLAVLRRSGKDGLSFKQHTQDPPMELWWLEETMSREDCWKLAESFPDACGLAAKTSNPPRYAIRFKTREQMEQAMRENGEGQQGTYGRYKASGIPTSTGFVGAWQLLRDAGYEVEEVVYHADNSLVFLASKPGESSFHYRHADFQYPVRVKAVNSVARAQVQAQATVQQPAQRTSRAQRQKQTAANANKGKGTTPPAAAKGASRGEDVSVEDQQAAAKGASRGEDVPMEAASAAARAPPRARTPHGPTGESPALAKARGTDPQELS